MRTLSRALRDDIVAIRGDVVTLGNQMEQLHIPIKRLQTHTDRELRYQITLW